MSFSRAPLSRFNEKNAQKLAAGRVVTPQVKDKTKVANSPSGAPRSQSKNNLSRQRSNSSTNQQLQLVQQQQLHQQSSQPQHQHQHSHPHQRGRGRVTAQCSTQSLEVAENIWTPAVRCTSRSMSRDAQERASRTQSKVSQVNPADEVCMSADSAGGGGGGGGGGSGPPRHGQALAKRRVMESQFSMKSKRFSALRKEVLDKQRMLTELHDNLIDMHDRLQAAGAKDTLMPDTLPWVEVEDSRSGGGGGRVGGSPRHHRRQGTSGAVGDEGAGSGTDLTSPRIQLSAPTEEAMKQLEMQLKAIPNACLEMCRDTINKRNEVLNWFSELDSSRELLDEEMRTKLEIYRREGEATDNDMEVAQNAQQRAVTAAVETLRALAAETENARAAQEVSAAREAAREAALDLARETADGQNREAQLAALELALSQEQERGQKLEAQLGAIMTDLHAAERRACAATDEAVAEHERFRIVTDQLGLMDGYLKEERQHMRELESRLTSDEGRIQKVNSQMSNLEEQLRVREAAHEQRLKVLAEEAHAQTETTKLLEAQKEALERRVQDLAALLAANEGGDTNALNQMNELKEQIQKELEKERELRISAQGDLEKEKSRTKELEEKTTQLTETLRSAGNSANEGSAALAQELETMKKQLRETLKKVASLEEERIIQEQAVRKLETRQAREREENQMLKAELQQRQQQLAEAAAQQRDARTRLEVQQERVTSLERQLTVARTSRPLEKVLQQQQADFQKKVTELQNALKEVVRHNDELEHAVMQKQQEVEQRERVMREQTKVLKVRDELIVLLKSKEQRQEEAMTALRDALRDNEDAQDKMSKTLEEKKTELQKLYETAEGKQLQVTKLETLVRQLEDQQERSQAQRTRQEARISSLERLLLQAQENQPAPPPKPPQRYAHANARAAPPADDQRQTDSEGRASFYFWDGNELKQIERIPPGAAEAPAKGTFYLTVVPKPRHTSETLQSADSPNMQFYVTANIGAHDVEEGIVAGPTEEALAKAADAAMTCAAYAALETGRRTASAPPPSPPPPPPLHPPRAERFGAGWPKKGLVHWRTPVVDSLHFPAPQFAPQDGRPIVEELPRNGGRSTEMYDTAPAAVDSDNQGNVLFANPYAGAGRNPFQMRPRSVPAHSTLSDVGFERSEMAASYWSRLPRFDASPGIPERPQQEAVIIRGRRLRAGSAEPSDHRDASPPTRGSRSPSPDRYQRPSSAPSHAPAPQSPAIGNCPLGSTCPPNPAAETSRTPDTFPVNFRNSDESRRDAYTSPLQLWRPSYDAHGEQSTAQSVPPGAFLCDTLGDSTEQEQSAPNRLPNTQAHDQKWYPWTYEEEPNENQHGDILAAQSSSRSRYDASFPLFFQRRGSESEPSTGGSPQDRQTAPWFAFRSHSPASGLFQDSHRDALSFVTLPGEDYSAEETCSSQENQQQPNDVERPNRLPLRSYPSFSRAGNRMDGGENAAFDGPATQFSVNVENASDDSAASARADKSARVQWGLPTIDEVNSEGREHSDIPSQRPSDSDVQDDDDEASIGSQGLSAITSVGGTCGTIDKQENAAAGWDLAANSTAQPSNYRKRDDSPLEADCWRSQRAEYSEISSPSTDVSLSPLSTDDTYQRVEDFSSSPRSERAQSPTTPRKELKERRSYAEFEANELKRVEEFQRNDCNGSPPQHLRSFEHLPQNFKKSGVTFKEPPEGCSTDSAKNSVSSQDSNKQLYVPHSKHKTRKSYTVFTSSSRNLARVSPNFEIDTSSPTKLGISLNTYHKSLSNAYVSNHAQSKDFQPWNDGHVRNKPNSFSKMKHTSETSVISPPAYKAEVQLSATLFDIQRTAGASDSNINSSFFARPSSSPSPRNTNQQDITQSHKSHHITEPSARESTVATATPVTLCSSTNSNQQTQYYESEQSPLFNFSRNATASDSTVPKLSNSRLLNSKSRTHVSKYKPIRNLLSKSCIASEPMEKLTVKTHTHAGINPVQSSACDLSWKNTTQQKVANLDKNECPSKNRHHHKSEPQSISVDRYSMDQIYRHESQEETDTLSEASYHLDQMLYETEDLYEADTLLTFQDPIYLSMQCLETCNCHGKTCKHIHW